MKGKKNMLRVGINGFGRIGRQILRVGLDNPNIEFVGVNDITDAKTLAHLFKWDSVHKHFEGEVKAEGNDIFINNKMTCHIFLKFNKF